MKRTPVVGRARLRAATGLCLSLWWAGCGDDDGTGPYTAPPMVLFDQFTIEGGPYDVLLRDCAFVACHGAEERFFQVYGPGRRRLQPPPDQMQLETFDEPTIDETSGTFTNAKEFIDPENPSRSMLLRKPLAMSAGGTGHGGVDGFGRDVYRTDNASGYVTLLNWVNRTREPLQ